MRRSLLLLGVVGFLVAWLAPAQAHRRPVLKKGERLVFFGDSITQQGGFSGGYVSLINAKLQSTWRGLGAQVFDAGIPGNAVPDLQARVDTDVIAKKPTLVVIYIGINDVWRYERLGPAFVTPKALYEAGLREIIGKIQKTGARVILCTPSVIGEKRDGENPLDGLLDDYASISRKVASACKVTLCDLHQAFRAYDQSNNPDDRDRGILTVDRVHLNPAGNRLVAQQLLGLMSD